MNEKFTEPIAEAMRLHKRTDPKLFEKETRFHPELPETEARFMRGGVFVRFVAYVRTIIWDQYPQIFPFVFPLVVALKHSLFNCRAAACLVKEYRQYLCLCESSEEEETCEEIERLFRAVDADSSSSSSEESKKSKGGAGSAAKPKDTAKKVKKVKKDKKARCITLCSN